MSTEKQKKELGERLRLAIEQNGESFRAFSERTGIHYRSLQQYLRAERSPGADALIKIAAHTDVNLYFLLLGVGDPHLRTSGVNVYAVNDKSQQVYTRTISHEDDAKPRAFAPPSLPDYEEAEQIKLIKALALGRLALIARRGSCAGPFRLLAELEASYPEPMTVSELEASLDEAYRPQDPRDLMADIALLVEYGLVRPQEGPGPKGYRAVEPQGELRSQSKADVHQHLLEAIRTLMNTVLPAVERQEGRGKLATLEIGVSEEEGVALIQALLDQVKQICARTEGSDRNQTLSVVLGAGLTPRKG